MLEVRNMSSNSDAEGALGMSSQCEIFPSNPTASTWSLKDLLITVT